MVVHKDEHGGCLRRNNRAMTLYFSVTLPNKLTNTMKQKLQLIRTSNTANSLPLFRSPQLNILTVLLNWNPDSCDTRLTLEIAGRLAF